MTSPQQRQPMFNRDMNQLPPTNLFDTPRKMNPTFDNYGKFGGNSMGFMPNDVQKTEPSAFINSSTPSSSTSNIFNRNQQQPPSNLATMTIQEKLQQERFQEQNSSASNGKVVVNEFIPGRSEWKAPARKDDSTATIGQMRQETA